MNRNELIQAVDNLEFDKVKNEICRGGKIDHLHDFTRGPNTNPVELQGFHRYYQITYQSIVFSVKMHNGEVQNIFIESK